MNAIEIRNLSKNFRGLYAVDNLNMTVPVGAIYGFIGENGSGKSTTEKLICGHLVPDGGEIKLFGRDYKDAGVRVRVAFFIGAMLGGVISSLPFDLGTAGMYGIVMCMISKMLLIATFVPIYLMMSVIAKQKTWLSLVLSFGVGMFLFIMIPMLTPLDATIINVALCLAGGVVFSAGMGVISNVILKKTSLV